MKRNYQLLPVLAFACLFASGSSWAQPTDNPYKTRYNTSSHWTDGLPWTNVTSAVGSSGLIGPGKQVDSVAIHSLMNTLSSNGGGVIYFAADTFRFSYNLIIPSSIVLRGANPTVANALDDNYRPPTVFEFPKYNPTFSGNGTPNSTAFKSIRGLENAGNIGLVNLDINRAHIGFHPEAWADAPGGLNTKWPVDINFNILVFGVRSNNVAIPDPGVPAAATGNQPAQQGWQRYVWRFTSNIGLYVSQNGTIVNCRVNDAPTDSYNQPGYVIRDANNGNCFAGGSSKLNPDGSDAKFEYTDHIGIDLNRAKINKDGSGSGSGPNGRYGIYGFVTYATPESEPQLFAPGNEIRDSYVFKTRRVGIIAAGNGLKVDNNKVRDRFNKIAFIRANGQGCETNNSATHENRGMDVSGWNLLITRNDIEVVRHTIGGPSGYPSVDGEGILVQECCGGTSVKDYNFKLNKLTQASSGYIGLWKMRTMYNVHLDSNDLGCKFIYLTANTNGASFSLFNSTINGNTNISGIKSDAGLGGSNLVIRGNSACGAAVIDAPGFATVEDNTGTTFTPGPGTLLSVPTASLVSPTANQEIIQGGILLFEAQTTNADSIRFFVNSAPVSAFQAASASNTYLWAASVSPGSYYVTAQVKNSAGEIWSGTVEVFVRPSSVSAALQGISVQAHPNPSNGLFRFSLPETMESASYQIFDFTGRKVNEGWITKEDAIVHLESEPAGIYQVRFFHKTQSGFARVVKK